MGIGISEVDAHVVLCATLKPYGRTRAELADSRTNTSEPKVNDARSAGPEWIREEKQMIKILCDKCGADCDRVSFAVSVSLIHNPSPLYVGDTGNPTLTDEPNKHVQFILCQDCYTKLGLPNVYLQRPNSKRIAWQETAGGSDTKGASDAV